jgi:hypothetical protein
MKMPWMSGEVIQSFSTLQWLLDVLKSEQAELRVIEGKNCFIVDFDTFHAAYERLASFSELFPSSVLTKAQFDNFEFRTNTVEQSVYYVCTPVEPVLDKLWKERYVAPKPVDA